MNETKTALERLRARAEEHRANYPAFDLARFMAWVETHEDSWIRWASVRSIPTLNKSRRSQESIARLASLENS
jgi:hypothetical protein